MIDVILDASLMILIREELAENDFIFEVLRHLIYCWRDKLAWLATTFPAVQHEKRVILDGRIDSAIGYCYWGIWELILQSISSIGPIVCVSYIIAKIVLSRANIKAFS